VHHHYRAAAHLNVAKGPAAAAACSSGGSICRSKGAAALALWACWLSKLNCLGLSWCAAAPLSCKRRHAQCVEVLVCNGASPLVLDNARHNSALHWAASCCRADCVGRLLGSGAIFQMQSGQLVAIAGALGLHDHSGDMTHVACVRWWICGASRVVVGSPAASEVVATLSFV
jgi:hypothetical protein